VRTLNLERLVKSRPRQSRHAIADVAFEPRQPSDGARLLCSCGEEMTVADFLGHRRANGLRTGLSHHTMGPRTNETVAYRRTAFD
jgi:hypothetical protein